MDAAESSEVAEKVDADPALLLLQITRKESISSKKEVNIKLLRKTIVSSCTSEWLHHLFPSLCSTELLPCA